MQAGHTGNSTVDWTLLRAAVDLKALDGFTIVVDCDVIQADGGTRTASITGGCIALHDAITNLKQENKITTNPFKQHIASISVGIYQGDGTGSGL